MTLFVACAALGGAILLVQLVLGFVGVGLDDGDVSGEHDASALGGLQLLTLRTLAAATAFFGIAGGGARAAGATLPLAIAVGVAAGVLAAVGVAAVLRAMQRVGRDTTPPIEAALGLPATVYIPVQPANGPAGKVHVTLGGRTVEYQAVTEGALLRTGALVEVVDVVAPDTVRVAPVGATLAAARAPMPSTSGA